MGLNGHLIVRAIGEAGRRNFTHHDPRRSFISNLLDRDVEISTFLELAGVSLAQTTTLYGRPPGQPCTGTLPDDGSLEFGGDPGPLERGYREGWWYRVPVEAGTDQSPAHGVPPETQEFLKGTA